MKKASQIAKGATGSVGGKAVINKGKATLSGQPIPGNKVPPSARGSAARKNSNPVPNTRGDKRIKGL